VGDNNDANADKSAVVDGYQLWKFCFEYHIGTNPDIDSDAYTAGTVQRHTQILATRQEHSE
jgi:hypothetical protein